MFAIYERGEIYLVSHLTFSILYFVILKKILCHPVKIYIQMKFLSFYEYSHHFNDINESYEKMDALFAYDDLLNLK